VKTAKGHDVARISEEAKQRYYERIKEYKTLIDTFEKREKGMQSVLEDDEHGGSYKRITLANESLDIVSYYLLMNELSLVLLGIKNEGFLNNARKTCYKALIYLEDVVSSYVDAPFSDYEEYLHKIEDISEGDRWKLLKKIGFTIDTVRESFGENSKWKWSFAELEARYATIAKNIMDLKAVQSHLDPRAEYYETYLAHLNLVKQLLDKSASAYRQKYELSTGRIDDFKIAIQYLGALRRMHLLLGESEQSDTIKKKMEVWKSKMESDSKSREQNKAKQNKKSGK
jgi:hypothetical protein